MFTIVRSKRLQELEMLLDFLEDRYLQKKLALKYAEAENARLWQILNQKMQARADKNGTIRNSDGTFARKE